MKAKGPSRDNKTPNIAVYSLLMLDNLQNYIKLYYIKKDNCVLIFKFYIAK